MSYSLENVTKYQIKQILDGLNEHQAMAMVYDWSLWARPEQLPPITDDWFTWFILAGRGFGKTRTGAEWTRYLAKNKYTNRIALVAPTAADARDTMVEGESGILAISPPYFRPVYNPSKRRLTWPNGVIGSLFSADEPERLRGPQHGAAWCDEVGSWRYPEAMDMLDFGLRLGKRPLKAITTTPKSTKFIKELLEQEHTIVVRGSTYDNRSNLAPSFFDQVVSKYEGTRLGRQELHAEILEESEGALWKRAWLDATRLRQVPSDVELTRIVVGIDPNTSDKKESDETGINVAGRGDDNRGYVLADYSMNSTTQEWARKAVAAYHDHNADCIVAEGNNGGDLVKTVIKQIDPTIHVKIVYASKGKYARAEPISMLYEQGRISHVGYFAELEDQQCNWDPNEKNGYSPDRMDSLVWTLWDLFKQLPPRPNDFNVMGEMKTINEFDINTITVTTPDW